MRRTDGEMIYGEFAWTSCDGPDDWRVAEVAEDDGDLDEPTEYEIVEMTVRSIAKRLVPNPLDFHDKVNDECDYCDEPWPCDWVRAHTESTP